MYPFGAQSLLYSSVARLARAEGYYFLMDCPGQVELFTLHDSLLAILGVMDKQWHFRCARPAAAQRVRAVCSA